MSKLKSFGTPGINIGVLHPKLQHQFRVHFELEGGPHDGGLLSEEETAEAELALQVLTSQVLSVSMPEMIPMAGTAMSTKTGHFLFTFEDDILSLTFKAIRLINQLRVQGVTLTTYIERLDGNEGVLHTFKLLDGRFGGVMFSPLTYEPSMSSFSGEIVDPWKEQPEPGRQYSQKLSISSHATKTSRIQVTLQTFQVYSIFADEL